MPENGYDYLVRLLRIGSKVLGHCVTYQRIMASECSIDLRRLVAHLDHLAGLVEVGALESARDQHRAFAVVEHARWLGSRPKVKREHQSFVRAGSKGGHARSAAKAIAAANNGKRGGRPRTAAKGVRLKDLTSRIKLWFSHPDSADPHLSMEAKKKIVQQIRYLPLRYQRAIERHIKKNHLNPEILGLSPEWAARLMGQTERHRLFTRSIRDQMTKKFEKGKKWRALDVERIQSLPMRFQRQVYSAIKRSGLSSDTWGLPKDWYPIRKTQG